MLTLDNNQYMLCSTPIRYDTYRGCTHGCVYCFANVRTKYKDGFENIQSGNVKELNSFLRKSVKIPPFQKGTPIHWGGMSDGFQPAEKAYKVSLESLKLLQKYQYPAIISTKGTDILTRPDYLDVLKHSKVGIQVSIAYKNNLNKLDTAAPDYSERLKAVHTLVENGVPVIIRIQPYFVNKHKEVLEIIDELPQVEGITVEGMKFTKKKALLVKHDSDYVYPLEVLFDKFIQLRDKAHKKGIRFLSAENRLRFLGDAVNCCGFSHLENFKEDNKLNLSQLLFYPRITASNLGLMYVQDKEALKEDYMGTLLKEFSNPDDPVAATTQSTKAHRQTKYLKDKGYTLYQYLVWYVNYGNFANNYDLKAIGKDEHGNKVFISTNNKVEQKRVELAKERKYDDYSNYL